MQTVRFNRTVRAIILCLFKWKPWIYYTPVTSLRHTLPLGWNFILWKSAGFVLDKKIIINHVRKCGLSHKTNSFRFFLSYIDNVPIYIQINELNCLWQKACPHWFKCLHLSWYVVYWHLWCWFCCYSKSNQQIHNGSYYYYRLYGKSIPALIQDKNCSI